MVEEIQKTKLQKSHLLLIREQSLTNHLINLHGKRLRNMVIKIRWVQNIINHQVLIQQVILNKLKMQLKMEQKLLFVLVTNLIRQLQIFKMNIQM